MESKCNPSPQIKKEGWCKRVFNVNEFVKKKFELGEDYVKTVEFASPKFFNRKIKSSFLKDQIFHLR